MNLHLVFVYGSLKRGEPHHEELAGARFVGAAHAPRARLIRYVEGYPALVVGEGALIVGEPALGVPGELYEVDDQLLGRLDAFEDCPLLYQRAHIEVVRDGGPRKESARAAFAYVVRAQVAAAYPTIQGAWHSR